jgi:hypothetical protein
MSKDERSLLLYLETCAVDNGGKINIDYMNDIDREIAERWNKSKFIGYGRIKLSDININSNKTHWCYLSDDAFAEAHKLRKERAIRMWDRRKFRTTQECRESA